MLEIDLSLVKVCNFYTFYLQCKYRMDFILGVCLDKLLRNGGSEFLFSCRGSAHSKGVLTR